MDAMLTTAATVESWQPVVGDELYSRSNALLKMRMGSFGVRQAYLLQIPIAPQYRAHLSISSGNSDLKVARVV